jgi:hypothetical protein
MINKRVSRVALKLRFGIGFNYFRVKNQVFLVNLEGLTWE